MTLSQARGATAKTQHGTETLRWGGGSQNPAGQYLGAGSRVLELRKAPPLSPSVSPEAG